MFPKTLKLTVHTWEKQDQLEIIFKTLHLKKTIWTTSKLINIWKAMLKPPPCIYDG